MPVNYDAIIDKLAEDPEFLDLTPDEQDQLIQEIAQEQMGAIPKSENFLQRAIRQSRQAGQFAGSVLPATGQEAMDLGKVGLRQALPESPGMVGLGAQMADPRHGNIELPAPQTEYGQNLENSANIAQLMQLGGATLPLAKKGIGSIINQFRTTPVKQGIEDLIFQGTQKVKGGVDDLFKKHNETFGKGMEGLESTMSSDDFADIIATSADEIGRYEKSNDVLTGELGRLLDEAGKIFSPSEVQSKSKRILQLLGSDNRGKAIFYKHFLDRIPETVPGLKELKSSHAPVYQTAKDAKMLGRGTMRKIASGKIGPKELNDAKKVQSKIGLDVISPLEQKGNELQKIIRNQKVGKLALTTAGAGGGILALLNAIKD